MGSLRFASGSLCNLLARARSVTFSSAASGYPGTNAFGGDVGKPWISAGGATETIDVDLVPDLYGDMEAFPTGWTSNHSGTGAGAIDSVNYSAGAASAKLQAGASGVAQYYRDATVAAGEEQRLVAKLRITSGSGTVRVRVQNRQTGRYLTSAGEWQDSATDVFTSTTTGSWDSKALTFTVETLPIAITDQVTLRTYIRCTDNCTANVDQLHRWPTWDVASLHGHNADASQAIAVYGGDTTASNLVATLTRPPARPSCYVRASSRQTYRFVQILLPGQNVAAFYAGEAVLWQSKVPTYSWQTLTRTLKPLQIRSETGSGWTSVRRLGTAPRSLDMAFQSTSVATYDELFSELWTRTREGVDPVIMIPDDDLVEVVYGRVAGAPAITTPMACSDVVDFRLQLDEDGFPTVGL